MGLEKGVEVRAALLSLGDSGYFFLNAFFDGEEVFEFFLQAKQSAGSRQPTTCIFAHNA